MENTLKSICIPLILRAGDVLLKEWEMVSVHHYKESEDMCTNLDIKIEAMILEELIKHFPEHNYESEEMGKGPQKDSDYTWLIDPIDGTKNYVRHLPFFCISMALLHKGEPIFGVVYAPKTEELYYASKGHGAFLLDQEHGETFESESTVKIHGTDVERLSSAQLHVELPVSFETMNKSDRDVYENRLGMMRELMDGAYRVRSFGSGAIALCYAAKGAYDGYVDLSGSTCMHDVAAGILICREAGLKVSDIHGEKFKSTDDQRLLVTNPKLSSQIQKLFN